MTYEDNRKEKIRVRTIKRAFIALTVLFFLVLTGFAWLLVDVRSLSQKNADLTRTTALLTLENTKRINEIQDSRTQSCRDTYSSFDKVFEPFFPPVRTKKERAMIAKFEKLVKTLKKSCPEQTKPKPRGS